MKKHVFLLVFVFISAGLYGQNIAPFPAAAYNNDLPALKAFLAEGRDINGKDANGYTALMWAVAKGHKDLARYLVQRFADVNAASPSGKTALILAAETSNYEMVGLLATYGANLRAADSMGNTALHYAMIGGRREIIDFLITFGAGVDEPNNEGLFPIDFAAQYGHQNLVYYLIYAGAYTGSKTQYPQGIPDTTTANVMPVLP